MEKIIVLIIVALAAVFVGYKFLARKNRGNCSCGCAGCDGANWNSGAADQETAADAPKKTE